MHLLEGHDLGREKRPCRPLHPKWPKAPESQDGGVGRAVGPEENAQGGLGLSLKPAGTES